MTNPDNIVRVRARNGGRASVYEANAWAQAFSQGLLEGNGVIQNTSADMNVLVGGSGTKPDVLLATNPAGYKIALDIVGQKAVAITKPASNSRISAIVAYTNDLSVASTQTNITGSPASCGLIVVNGSTASSPVAPTDAQIRSAITADGATGSQAAYCVIATIRVASNTTIINDNLITNNIAVISSNKINFREFGGDYSMSEEATKYKWVDGKTIYKKTFFFQALSDSEGGQVSRSLDVVGLGNIVKFEGIMSRNGTDAFWDLSYKGAYIESGSGNIIVTSSMGGLSDYKAYVTVYFTKTSV